MSDKKQGGKGGKKARTHKVSRGIHGGGGKVRLTDLQRVLLGKGGFTTWKPEISSKTTAWRGVDGVIYPAFPEQARENRHKYPHLFSDVRV